MNLLRTVYLWIIKHSKPDKVMYIGGSDTLPPPLEREEEAELIERLAHGDMSLFLFYLLYQFPVLSSTYLPAPLLPFVFSQAQLSQASPFPPVPAAAPAEQAFDQDFPFS